MRKDVREFIRRLESAGLTVESKPGHYHVVRDGLIRSGSVIGKAPIASMPHWGGSFLGVT
jgi:biotin operon repressor